ncbi:MAG: trypsin-like serine protease [Myxococcales bacterium]|nr:trypsin-like serine protease [Myxococcales bacterium]
MRPRPLTHLASLTLTLAAGACVEQDLETTDDASQEIVGGAATQITSVPWQVSLQSAAGNHFCGGSIVTPTWIVTAAHCVAEGAPGRIVAGISRLSQSGAGQIRSIKRVVSYPGYSSPEVGKDAAMIELTEPLTLNGTTVKAIRPLTAASSAALTATGVTTTVSGWGATAEGGTTLPDQLQWVQVPVISLDSASASYGTTLTPDQLAAGLAAGGKDSCQGDSGGPLVVADGAEMALAGIVSWGEGCARANRPGLYARVTSFAKWMDGLAGGPPVAAAGDDRSASPGSRVQLDASASKDAGFGQIASYSWRQVSGTAVTLEGGTTKTPGFTAPTSSGLLELELTVTDDQGTSATDRIQVSVKPGGGTGTGPGTGGGDGKNGEDDEDTITGGCAASGGSAGPMMLLLALGLVFGRRRARG